MKRQKKNKEKKERPFPLSQRKGGTLCRIVSSSSLQFFVNIAFLDRSYRIPPPPWVLSHISTPLLYYNPNFLLTYMQAGPISRLVSCDLKNCYSERHLFRSTSSGKFVIMFEKFFCTSAQRVTILYKYHGQSHLSTNNKFSP